MGGKGFGRNDEQRSFRVDFGQYVARLGAVHIGDEVHVQARMAERLERGTHHQRAKVGAADTDVDDVGNDLIGIAQPAAAADFMRELAHAFAGHG